MPIFELFSPKRINLKTNSQANTFAKLSASSASSINECHVNRVEFSLAETSKTSLAVNFRLSFTTHALLEHSRICSP